MWKAGENRWRPDKIFMSRLLRLSQTKGTWKRKCTRHSKINAVNGGLAWSGSIALWKKLLHAFRRCASECQSGIMSAPCSVMAQAPRAEMADLGLCALLGRRGPHKIRKTNEVPARISVIDVAVLITGHGRDYAAQAVRNICEGHPAVSDKITDCKFPGERQRKTPVTDVKGIVARRARNTHQQIRSSSLCFGGAVRSNIFRPPRRSSCFCRGNALRGCGAVVAS